MLDIEKNDIKQTLGLNNPVRHPRPLIIISVSIILIGLGLAFYLLIYDTADQSVAQFETVALKRGDLIVTVTATGKLEPVTEVDIGIEVSGTVADIKADFSDHVKAGQVLATLDLRLFQARVKQSQGAFEQAKGKLTEIEATIAEKQQVLALMQHARQLSAGQLPAKQDLIAAQANLNRAIAQKSQILASIQQTEGQLQLDQTNLLKASIRTPIDGIVLDRKIEKGQTVAASLQTPVMFTVAKNLTEMELHVDVDEADIGKISLQQPASFTVDAYPNQIFPAIIKEIRYAPQTINGVVTYPTLLSVNNSQLLLRPGMTATAEIIVNQIKNTFLVPNAALRFSLDTEPKKTEPSKSFVEKLLPTPPRSSIPKKAHQRKLHHQKNSAQVWTLDHNQPKSIPVTQGLSDGEMTVIASPALAEGMLIIIDTMSAAK